VTESEDGEPEEEEEEVRVDAGVVQAATSATTQEARSRTDDGSSRRLDALTIGSEIHARAVPTGGGGGL
jgi:hypothetical protein